MLQYWRVKKRPIKENLFVCWCFKPSQLPGVTSGLNTNFNLSLCYSAHKSFNINHNISTAQLFQTYTHTHKITHNYAKPQIFSVTVKICVHAKFTSKYLIIYRTYQSLSGSQTFSPDLHFKTMNTKIPPQNIYF